MTKEKAERIFRIYNWMRFVIVVLFLTFVFVGLAGAQTTDTLSIEQRLSRLEQQLIKAETEIAKHEEKSKYMPQVHGILRGKFEYQPDLNAGRFEVRNARFSVNGKLPLRSEYKLEVDLCDESQIKMKDAWVRVNPWRSLRMTLGQQRMPFSIDAHRNPSAQYFVNRSFIAKQVGDMRDVGAAVGYDFTCGERKILSLDAGIYNGSNLDNQKTAWFKSPAYSARIQYFPVKGLALVPSVQHQQIAERKASYTSLDFGTYYEVKGWHVEAEYLHKFYAKDAFSDCSAVDAMVIYKQNLKLKRSFIESISYLGRYDWMQDHSSGKSGFDNGASSADEGAAISRLVMTDAERHRITLGATFAIRNPYFPTDIRLNYEKYWYPHGSAKESEQDKLVCEVMIRF